MEPLRCGFFLYLQVRPCYTNAPTVTAPMVVYLARYTVLQSSTCLRVPFSVRVPSVFPPTTVLTSIVIGMHAIKDKPVVVDGQIVIRPIMIVALTYDHRLLDGREAVTFLGMSLSLCSRIGT